MILPKFSGFSELKPLVRMLRNIWSLQIRDQAECLNLNFRFAQEKKESPYKSESKLQFHS